MEADVRDAVVDFIRDWAEKTGLAINQMLEWLGLSVGKFYQWRHARCWMAPAGTWSGGIFESR